MTEANQLNNKRMASLYKAIAKIRTKNEAANFLRDLCTLEELEEMSRRWQAAEMLNQGKPYREIAKLTGLSTTTVTRVAYWFNYGKGGYKLILKRK